MEERFLYQTESIDGRQHGVNLIGSNMGISTSPSKIEKRVDISNIWKGIYPYGEYACISRDGGNMWEIENEVELCFSMNDDLGYPASVQLQDGSIFTVYYQLIKRGRNLV